MKFIKTDSYEEMCRQAADIYEAQLTAKPDSVLGLATGSTPIGLYKQLIERNKSGKIDFSKVRTVNLDEYIGLPESDPQSYRYFMNNNLFYHVNIDPKNTFVPNGTAADVDAFCKSYDENIKRLGGIDIQLLGIGVDGHIGFNEPCDEFVAPTHAVTLDESTIKANARFFEKESDVPTSAITMGMEAIMKAKKIVFVANGANKKEIVEKAFFGPITPQVPASILQLHPDVTVFYSAE